MSLEAERKELEDRLLAYLVRMSRIKFGQLSLSIWEGQLYQTSDRNSRRPNDPVHVPVDLALYQKHDKVRSAVANLCKLWDCRFGTIEIKVKDARLIYLDVHRYFSDPIEVRMLRMQQQGCPVVDQVA